MEEALRHAHEAFSCFITPAHTDPDWFHELAARGNKHCFRGRVAYVPPQNVEASSPSFPSMLTMFGPRVVSSGLGFSRARHAKTGVFL